MNNIWNDEKKELKIKIINIINEKIMHIIRQLDTFFRCSINLFSISIFYFLLSTLLFLFAPLLLCCDIPTVPQTVFTAAIIVL